MEINFIIQILFQSITQEPGQQISSWIFAHFNDVICGSGVSYLLGPLISRTSRLRNWTSSRVDRKILVGYQSFFRKLKVSLLTKLWLPHWFLTRDTATWQINKGKQTILDLPLSRQIHNKHQLAPMSSSFSLIWWNFKKVVFSLSPCSIWAL